MYRFFSRAARLFGWITFLIIAGSVVSAFVLASGGDDPALIFVGVCIAGGYACYMFFILWAVCSLISWCSKPEREEEAEIASALPVSNLHTADDGRWVSSSEERRLSNLHHHDA